MCCYLYNSCVQDSLIEGISIVYITLYDVCMHNYVTDCIDNRHFPNVNLRSNSESCCYIWDGKQLCSVYIAARSHTAVYVPQTVSHEL